jgi:hypothetical protein
MNLSSLSRYLPSLGIAMALAGCTGPQSQSGAPGAMPSLPNEHSRVAGRSHDTIGREVFTNNLVDISHIGTSCRGTGPYVSWNNPFFSDYGTAKGVLNGTFQAQGYWNYWRNPSGKSGWGFVEVFSLGEGSTLRIGSISAGSPSPMPHFTCKKPRTFGPATFQYQVKDINGKMIGSGKVKIEIIKSSEFHETLRKFPG